MHGRTYYSYEKMAYIFIEYSMPILYFRKNQILLVYSKKNSPFHA